MIDWFQHEPGSAIIFKGLLYYFEESLHLFEQSFTNENMKANEVAKNQFIKLW